MLPQTGVWCRPGTRCLIRGADVGEGMDLLIEGALWRPSWQAALQAWQHQGNRWWLLLGKGEAREMAPWSVSPPDGILLARDLLAAWLGEAASPLMATQPDRQILIAASGEVPGAQFGLQRTIAAGEAIQIPGGDVELDAVETIRTSQ